MKRRGQVRPCSSSSTSCPHEDEAHHRLPVRHRHADPRLSFVTEEVSMESFATPYPVIFYDGECEHEKGQVGVHSVLTFKRFQSLLSQKVGFPAGQLSAVFVCRHMAKDMDAKRQKLPINKNTNFNIILNQHNPMWEKDCHFLVSVKKPKRERKSIRRRNADVESGGEDDLVLSQSDNGQKDFFGSADDVRMQDRSINAGSMATSPEETATQQKNHWTYVESSTAHGNLMNQRRGSMFLDGGPHGEKVLLRREQHGSLASSVNLSKIELASMLPPYNSTVQQSSPLQQAWSGSVLPHQKEGWKSVRQSSPPRPWESVHQSSTTYQMETWKSMRQSSPPRHEAETWKLTGRSLSPHQAETWKNNQSSRQKEAIEGRETGRDCSNVLAQQPFHVGAVVASSTGGFQERYNGVVRARSTAFQYQNGALNFSNTAMSLSPFASPKEGAFPLTYPISTGALLFSRVSHGLASGATAALQQAQAHYLNVQAQHSEQMHLNSHPLPKMRGVVRNLAACEESPGVCEHCCTFQERNVDPTPFHLCVHDRVTNGFRGRPPAGPIERPAKRVEAAA